ncbi:hypothetical protein EKO04_009027 [Ascochyta lentis]|uniref:Arrestin-like N-terminal domain-containing protein n=1 Tax=Ascochyta lentis TaxID=205686 RepID=A0A8H7MFG8_9PLEO|nr:hypothetical protein EKO04_009027 [Ascochyta lentis]
MPTHNTTKSSSPPVYIDVQSSCDYYTNNDLVYSFVRVHPTERPNGVKIAIRGRCKLKVRTDSAKRNSRSTFGLFSYEGVLFSASQLGASYGIVDYGIASDGRVELPFEFAFPNEVQMPPDSLYEESIGFENQKGHPLPISLGFAVGHGTKTDEYRVEYFLEALVYKEGTWEPDDVIRLMPPFQPTDYKKPSDLAVARPRSSEFCIRSHKMDPRNDPNPNALTKLKWSTRSKYKHAVPEARWNIIAHCPYRLAAGTSIPIFFSFYHLGRSPEITTLPIVYVRQIRVKLTLILTVRVPYQGFSGDRDMMDSSAMDILNEVFTAQNTTMRHGLQLEELGELELPPDTLPSFKFYGLRLAFRIKVGVDGECAQEKFSVTVLRGECKVVCGVRRSSATAASSVDVLASAHTH